MSKRIAIYLDGTCDSPASDTNIYKMFKSTIVSHDQIAFYHDGLGVDGLPLDRLMGAEFGDGLFTIIKAVYATLAHCCEPGDAIYIFGFSRGAFTARALASMIADIGLPSDPLPAGLVDDAFAAYRDPSLRPALTARYGMAQPQITMVGVFDTVAAIGLLGAPEGGNDPLVAGFLDTQLHPCIQNAYQALSIDERRREFAPTLWMQSIPELPNQVLEQVWFCGGHCDVGGGYGSPGLSDIPLAWLTSKAAALGLIFNPMPQTPDAKYALGKITESWNVLWLMPKHRTIPADATLANSVAIRLDEDPTYRPKNLNETSGVLDADYGAEVVVAPV